MAEISRRYEQLNHFECGYCFKWWSIGDPVAEAYFCPHCGHPQKVQTPVFVYKGLVRNRPMGRGVILIDKPYDGNQQIEDALPREGDFYAEIVIYEPPPMEKPNV